MAGAVGFEPTMTISKTVALDRARRYPNKTWRNDGDLNPETGVNRSTD